MYLLNEYKTVVFNTLLCVRYDIDRIKLYKVNNYRAVYCCNSITAKQHKQKLLHPVQCNLQTCRLNTKQSHIPYI